ncbi:calcium-binding protein [Albimonas pacifica]|uniref:Hemolysin-type calcium-binding repeat-containing protein n=1 Tax=Albimonas pacifica TaxID=1114924 RepID=A0A1I3HMN0_9RHOB|nr:M10 family metallopeptidase C-terminal domain-containing protein [Albimonas pacifica]SFI36941.1 hypothetical protein SAMN05216258_10677 [Albimonas pacifica]
MAFILATDGGAQIELSDGDRLYIPRDVTVAVPNQASVVGDAGDANGHEVTIDGALISGGGNAIILGDDALGEGDNRLVIGETGVVRSLNVPGNSSIYMLGSNSVLQNAGEVTGNWGAFLQDWDGGSILNTGLLQGMQQEGLYLTSAVGVGLINTGLILGDVDALGGVEVVFDRLFNSGEIIGGAGGHGIAIAVAPAGSLVVNRGLIAGDEAAVQLAQHDDVLRNRGDVDGDVRLGDGADVYVGGRRSEVDGRIQGEGGDDVLRGGGNDDLVFGGDGADEIHGRKGDDELIGNADADVFVIARRNGDDEIRDLVHGEDHVDLSAFDLRWKPLKNKLMEDTDDGVLIDLEGQRGGTVLLEGLEIADISRGDFIL